MPTFNSDDVLVTPANVLYAPVGTALPDESTVEYNADSGAYTSWTGWTLLGYTTAPTSFTYGYETFDVEVQQSAAPIKSSKTNETLTLSFTLAQFDADILALVLDGTANDTAAGPGQKAFSQVDAGGDTQLSEYMFAVEAYRTEPSTGIKQPVRIFVYRGSLSVNGDISFDKGGVTQVPCQVTALADSTKPVGSQLVSVQIITGGATTT